MSQPIQVIHRKVTGHWYILRYYDCEIGRQQALLALDQWRTHHALTFGLRDMDEMAETIYDEPVTSPRFTLPIPE